MQEYRRVLKEHFEKQPVFRSLLSLDAVFYGFGLLFLLLSWFNLSHIPTDFFDAIGIWLFWFGILLAFIRKGDVSLTVGLGIYTLLDFIRFIVACNRFGASYSFDALFGTGIGILLLVLTIQNSDFYLKYRENSDRDAPYSPQFNPINTTPPDIQPSESPEHGRVLCPNCGKYIALKEKFCPYCGFNMQGFLYSNTSSVTSPKESVPVQVASQQKKVSDEEAVLPETAAPSENEPPESEIGNTKQVVCPSCGKNIKKPNAKFCPYCGQKIASEQRCGNCGSLIPKGAASCVVCGKPVGQESEAAISSSQHRSETQICPSCGAEMPVDKKFCTQCGAKLK